MISQSLFLFATPEILLGDVVVRGGSFERITLTEAGEKRLGSTIASWQEKGISTGEHLLPIGRAGFQKAFQEWCDTQQIVAISLHGSVLVECGQALLHLPFPAAERFLMLQDLAHANADALIAWQQFLVRAQEIVRTEKYV